MKRSLYRPSVQGRLALACCLCLFVSSGCSPGHEFAKDQDLQQHAAAASVGAAKVPTASQPSQQHSNHLPDLQLASVLQTITSTTETGQPSQQGLQLQHNKQHDAAAVLLQLQASISRKLAQATPGYKPSSDEKRASKTAGHMSAGHAFGVVLLCLLAMAVLGFSTWKAMQWIERSRRPGYVELQSLDTAYHRPWTTV